ALFDLFIRDKASPEQAQQLLEYLKDPANGTISQSLLTDILSSSLPPTKTIAADNLQNAWDDMLSKAGPSLQNALSPQSADSSVRRMRPVLRWLAAASAILALAIAAYIWKGYQKPVSPAIATKPKHDIHPGKTGAVLTLSDGSQVLLDTIKNATVAVQSGIAAKVVNGSLVYQGQADAIVYNTMTTPKGRQYHLTLPDGSGVWLNAASSITYPTTFRGKERLVEITGEAYFEVVHDAGHPFRVRAAGQLVEDIGTAFNINAYADEPNIKTTLAEGAVKVNERTFLHPGQQSQLMPDGTVSVISNADVGAAIAWKDGRFQFNKASLPEVMRQVSRWYDVDIVYDGPVTERKFGGDIPRSTSVSKVLSILEESEVHFKIDGNKVIVMP
ncbi:MAG: DUF4974 domain-containing protein, partial [Bacteroidetes bacterium]|nr:DUF4974 domain-containing protein [Bacteroidota bacterium]